MNKRITLLALAVLFFGPVIAAYLWFFYLGGASQQASVNKGDLVDPPVALADYSLAPRGGNGTEMPFSEDWTILVVAPERCSEPCQQALVTTRQVWRRLNRNMDRVQRIAVVGPGVEIDQAAHPVLRIFENSDAFETALDNAVPGQDASSRVMLVDPFGNLMMSYPIDLEPEMLYDDLARLLRYSQAG